MGFPKEKFWNRLLQETNCKGFYFTDYPVITNMICPEESHLSPQDAIVFTQQFLSRFMSAIDGSNPREKL